MADQYKTSKPIKDTINAYFNFVLTKTLDTDKCIIKIYDALNGSDATSIKLYHNCFLINTNTNNKNNNINGKKVMSLFIVFNEIEITEYYELMKIIRNTCLKIIEYDANTLLFIDSDYTVRSKTEVSNFNNQYIDIKNRNFSIKNFKGYDLYGKYDLFIRIDDDCIEFPSHASFKILVYAIDINGSVNTTNKSSDSLSINLNHIFKEHDYIHINEFKPIKPISVGNVSLYPNGADNPISNVLCYQHVYDGCVEMYNSCINNLVSYAKSSGFEIIGIIVRNELDKYILMYKSNPTYRFHLTTLLNDNLDDFNQIVI